MAFGGVFSVLPTPFTASGDIDSDSLTRVIDLFISDGVNGFTALGVTSEVARLTDAERDRVLDTVLAHVNGRVPVVAGTTAEGLRTCIELTRRARQAGAAAVMISPPRMPKINSDALRGISRRSRQRSRPRSSCRTTRRSRGTRWSRRLLRASRATCRRRERYKLEDPPTPFKTARILEQTKGLEVAIFGGLGGVFLLEELMAGAAGAMTGFAFPQIPRQIVTLFRAGQARRRPAVLFYRKVPLMRFEFQEGIGMGDSLKRCSSGPRRRSASAEIRSALEDG
jgi:4-hydroxy-tetrahydrodipicolinate synthase